jgi:hypothetical protein
LGGLQYAIGTLEDVELEHSAREHEAYKQAHGGKLTRGVKALGKVVGVRK